MAKAQITDPIERRQILCLGNGTFFSLAKFSRGRWFSVYPQKKIPWIDGIYRLFFQNILEFGFHIVSLKNH